MTETVNLEISKEVEGSKSAKYPRRSLSLKNQADEWDNTEGDGHETNQMMQADMFSSFVASSAHTSKSKPVERKRVHEIDTTFYGKKKIKRDTKKDVKDLNKMTAEPKQATSSEKEKYSVENTSALEDSKKKNEDICREIKSKSAEILHVETAYRAPDKTNIVFLIFAAKDIDLKFEWNTEIRVINKYSNESRDALYCKENRPLSQQESRNIGSIIEKHSKTLLLNHKYLSSISASSVKSKNYGKDDAEIQKNPCIVLDVLVKGIVPIEEEEFPKELEGIPVDVREGGCQFSGNQAEQCQKHLKMGCKITPSNLPDTHGTLGGFIEHPVYGICGITCAHVPFKSDEKQKLKEKSTLQESEIDPPIYMYQPSVCEPIKIGKLVQVIYKEGEGNKPGVNLAIFKIDKRAPVNGEFPEETPSMSFNTGLVWGKSGIPIDQTKVQKFGSVTGKTEGIIETNENVVREIAFNSNITCEDATTLTATLFKQYLIKSVDQNIKFCKRGDTGALVFMEDKCGQEVENRCIGMVVGLSNNGYTGIVTPITAIMDNLKSANSRHLQATALWKKWTSVLTAWTSDLTAWTSDLTA